MATPGRGSNALVSLRAIPLFSKVCEEDLASVAAHLIERRVPKGLTIVEEGLEGDFMYLLCEGRVKVVKLSDDGREKILEMLDAGAFFGEMALLDRAPRSASVKTLTPVRLLALSRADFLDVLRCSPDLAIALIRELSLRLRRIDEQASSLSFQRVKERAMALFDRLALDPVVGQERRATPPLTHQQIADMIGTSRETVTRVVKRLKRVGWLQQSRKRYLVPAPIPDETAAAR
jgi:CRP-like cAMP-binding protein